MAKTLAEELVKRISFAQGAGWEDAPSRFDGLLQWLESEPGTFRVLEALRKSANIEALLKDKPERAPPKVRTPEDVARVGLFFFEYCRDHPDNLPGIMFGFGCHDSGVNDFRFDFINAQNLYINPFLSYLHREVMEGEEILRPEALVDFRENVVMSDEFLRTFSQTGGLIRKTCKELSAFRESENWFNIANSCREVCKTFASELNGVSRVQLPKEIAGGDFKGVVNFIVGERIQDDRLRRTLVAMTEAMWNHIQCLLHRKNTSRSEAIRAVLWTCMVLAEVYDFCRTPKAAGNAHVTAKPGSAL